MGDTSLFSFAALGAIEADSSSHTRNVQIGYARSSAGRSVNRENVRWLRAAEESPVYAESIKRAVEEARPGHGRSSRAYERGRAGMRIDSI